MLFLTVYQLDQSTTCRIADELDCDLIHWITYKLDWDIIYQVTGFYYLNDIQEIAGEVSKRLSKNK